MIILATLLSHSIPVGELPKKIWDKSEHPKGSHKPIEILAQNTKQMAIKSEKFLVLAVTFTPLLQFTNGFRVWSAFWLLFKKTPITPIFIAMSSLAIMAKMTKMALIAVMEYYEMALNIVFMGVFLKSSKNPDQTWKKFGNRSNGLKVMAKTKNFSDFMAIRFVFWANISTGLWDPLGCSDLSQIFFGSSPLVIYWDKIGDRCWNH